MIAIGFMLLVALVNFRGVGESVKANVVLTCVELSGLLLVIFVAVYAMSQGRADFSRVTVFETPEDKSIFLAVTTATSLAFFAMVGSEDSVNMAEETREPTKIFPTMMLTGLPITGLIYVLVSMSAVALVPPGELSKEGATPLLLVVQTGAPNLPIGAIFPFISMFGWPTGTDQHAHGVAAAVRHGARGRAAAGVRSGAPEPAHALGGHHLHHPAGGRADHRRRSGVTARRHHRPAATGCVHAGQRGRGVRKNVTWSARGRDAPTMAHATLSLACCSVC